MVVDRLSKYGHFLALKHHYTAPQVVELFLREVVRIHGFPSTIISNKDKVFLSLFLKELFKRHITSLKYSSAYHPQINGATKMVNRSVKTYLRCLAGDCPKQ